MKSESGAGGSGEIKKAIALSGAVPEGVVCPACWGELRGKSELGAETLRCVACGRRYPVVDGIPVLIVERALEG
jgi:uncharacterized protein YbaR (Trm112 family)